MSADFSGLVGKTFESGWDGKAVLVLAAFVHHGELSVVCVDVSNPTTPPSPSGPAFVRTVDGLRLVPPVAKGDY